MNYDIFFYFISIFFLTTVLLKMLERKDDIYIKARRVIYCFWTGTNEMSENRKKCLDNLTKYSGVPVILVTPTNLNKFTIKDEPLHGGYQYLSETHKADYLRTYFMRFHGGGYSDIKKTTGDWNDSFTKLNNSDKWIIGYKEYEGGSANKSLENDWKDLIGNGAYICKPNTAFTKEWIDNVHNVLDCKLKNLKIFPAQHPRDFSNKIFEDGSVSDYPLRWTEICGEIFHLLCLKYSKKLLKNLPSPDFTQKYL